MKKIPFHKPEISPRAIRAVTAVIRSGWLTTGPRVREFEQAFARYVRARHALALNSGTAALHLALDAIGLKPGDEVIVPVNTFAATAEVVEYFNAKPVFCDIRPDTQNINETMIESLVTRRTRAVIPVHYGGHPCEMDVILRIARRHGLKVIEDAAHCTPAYYRGKPVGSMGDITCFSFYANKCITTGEGGMAVTNSRKYHERMRTMSLHGLSHDAWKRYDAKGSWRYDIVDRGFKYNMTDVAAALGLDQLREADKLWRKRRKVAKRYHQLLGSIHGIQLPAELGHVRSAWYIYPIRLASHIGRDGLIARLAEFGIKTSVHFIPLHLHSFYRKKYGYRKTDFPAAHRNFLRSVTLPFYPGMTPAEQRHVVKKIRAYVSSKE